MISEQTAVVRAWLANYWARRDRARDLARQYDAMREHSPRVLADVSRFCCAFDSTLVAGDRDMTLVNQGKREVWLHIQAMLGIGPEDLEHLKEETEREY